MRVKRVVKEQAIGKLANIASLEIPSLLFRAWAGSSKQIRCVGTDL